jgi:DNA-binding beta-propeller fold protein YncE
MQISRWVGCGMLCLIAGCATKPVAKTNYTFFPPPPDEPHIQFLMSFGSENDLGGRSKLNEFVVGQERLFNPIWKPYGITVAKGMVYVCDTQPANVVMVDLNKRKLDYLKPGGQAAMKMPINIAVDPEGTRYVTDAGRGQVLIYAKDGSYVGALGKTGEMKPCGIALAGDRLYVTDLSNHCVHVYGKAKRELLFNVPRNSDEKARLFSPTNVAVDQQGLIYVSDTGGFLAQVYDPEGNYLRCLGEPGIDPGRFARPKGIGVDHAGRTYVVDAATTVVQIFDAQGHLLMHFGEPKTSGPGALYLPAGVAIDYSNLGLFQKYVAPGYKLEHLIFVTNQVGTQKVSVYGFLRKS